MLVGLRDRIGAHAMLAALPHLWRAEVDVGPAYGEAFAGDFAVANLSDTGDFFGVVIVDLSGKGLDAGTRRCFCRGFWRFPGCVCAQNISWLPPIRTCSARTGARALSRRSMWHWNLTHATSHSVERAPACGKVLGLCWPVAGPERREGSSACRHEGPRLLSFGWTTTQRRCSGALPRRRVETRPRDLTVGSIGCSVQKNAWFHMVC